jgi:putative flippase GtrA
MKLCAVFRTAVGVVTADADGQHAPDDVLAVAEQLTKSPNELVLGTRLFDGNVPLRSRVGNGVTRFAVRLLLGTRLHDTQTGLRGIPRALIPHLLRIRSSGFEFELDMLVTAKHRGFGIAGKQIATIYEPGNPSSHFNPLRDSMRIGFVLTRFSALSLLTAVVDNLAFIALQHVGLGLGASQAGARLNAMLFNYGSARRAVFLSNDSHRSTLPRYLLLVLASGLVSYGLIRVLLAFTPLDALRAKLLAESALFLANFALQRDFVFTSSVHSGSAATDWTRYYRTVPPTARVTRRYTARVLINLLRRFAPQGAITITEYGGANSCFMDGIRRQIRPSAYHVIDTNRYGLELLGRR